MRERIVAFFTTSGPVKTPTIAVAGWFTWAKLKGLLETTVLLGTTIIVLIHVFNAVTRQWCPRRRTGIKDKCRTCKLHKTVFCPIKTRDYDDL